MEEQNKQLAEQLEKLMLAMKVPHGRCTARFASWQLRLHSR